MVLFMRSLTHIPTHTHAQEDDNVDKEENKQNADRELMRFEWVEMLVRVAFAKYVDSGLSVLMQLTRVMRRDVIDVTRCEI
jgi:hypothetical protein